MRQIWRAFLFINTVLVVALREIFPDVVNPGAGLDTTLEHCSRVRVRVQAPLQSIPELMHPEITKFSAQWTGI